LSAVNQAKHRQAALRADLRDAQQVMRERVWAALRRVARPDSRFHWDFSSFIADFEGSERCTERIRQLDAYRDSQLLFITPDNSLETVRVAAMADGKKFVMTTYGIARGFLRIDPAAVPAAERSLAATLDGVERYAMPVSLAELRRGPQIGLMVTGSSVISTSGVRFGKGHGYFDLEWAILSELGVAGPATEIAAVGHDCQVVEETVPAFEHDTVVDWIVTPGSLRRVRYRARARGSIDWPAVSEDMLRTIPPLLELQELLRRASA
jgi:5-formyltetrahydrofolate cyclo-ligase